MHMSNQNVIAACMRMDNRVLSADGDRARAYIHSALHREVAHLLVKSRIDETRRDYHTEFRVELYVFTPDEFARAVQQEAMSLTRYMFPMATKMEGA